MKTQKSRKKNMESTTTEFNADERAALAAVVVQLHLLQQALAQLAAARAARAARREKKSALAESEAKS